VEQIGATLNTINIDTWSITLFRKQKRLQIATQDYHAGPLMLSRDQLIDIARKMGLHVRTRNRKAKGGEA
jgi:hypothetical protein